METKTILLVEDDQDLIEMMNIKLIQAGFIVVKAETGQEALDYLKQQHPDLVLLDILLPDIDGLTVLNEISLNPRISDIPVIILSNVADVGAIEQAKAIGKYEYLVKAKTNLNNLVSKIRNKIGETLLL